MKTHEQSGNEFISPHSSKITNSEKYSSKFLGIIDQAHSVNTLHFLSAIFQITLGLTAIFLSTAGFISPMWLSVMVSMFASVVTMIGIYFLYTIVSRHRGSNRLLRDAMRRIMDAKN
ncbi:hypothetical protein G3570_11340 [Balneolaceae bacterium YR4-1]|uniref:Uncharacterized protein n=1 Tax=Halalkalibaculum roseum TaxID=2709311 RepID=A0A6M1SWA7_9BACT|nr:hypothetical protein [Halalkalibaculum roseum]NGP77232.1 hypothetical protein [Halalkalibaculum roseum]